MKDPYIDLIENYGEYAALQRVVCTRLLERVEHQLAEPLRIACVGCGDGQAPAHLKKLFRKARVVALDSSPALLSLASRKSSLLRPFTRVCASLEELPFADRSFDLVVASLAGHWRHDGARLMEGYRRVLKPKGMLLFSSFGIGSFSSLAVKAGTEWIEPGFVPFEDILQAGDQVMAAGFREPVMDTDRLTLTYPDFKALCTELEGSGITLEAREWSEWKHRVQGDAGLVEQMTVEGRIPLRCEVIYGAAFAPEDGQPMRSGGEELATFSVESLRSTLKKK